MDFYEVMNKPGKNGSIDVYPDFKVCKCKDLMVRGHSFYAVYNEETGFWSTDPYELRRLVDQDLEAAAEELRKMYSNVRVLKMSSYASRSWENFCSYINKLPDNFVQLDSKPVFADFKPSLKDYASKQLSYSLSDAEPTNWNELVGYLYDEDERRKIEWTIGAIISGESVKIQKFLVFFGAPGTGKSTIIDIIQKLFDGYWGPFDSKLLSSTDSFALEALKDNPLVGIEHDGDLSKIKDNSKLNSVVSHEVMLVNEKHKPKYSFRFNTFLIMGTNKPVKITDAKAGTIRRLIDVQPTGRTIPEERYFELLDGINYELGAIANHCLKVFKKLGKSYYNSYKPLDMMSRTDPFFNFVELHYDTFNTLPQVTLKNAFELYKKYVEEYCANEFKPIMFEFRDNLKDYFDNFDKDLWVINENGKREHYSSVYTGFKSEKFKYKFQEGKSTKKEWLEFKTCESLLDDVFKDCPAQYSNRHGVPSKPWKDVSTTLKDLDTTKEHYLQVPQNMIVIDFDIRGEDGEKNFELNYAEALKWPKTYAELSKSGKGIHLHYFYDGDPIMLSRRYADAIEVKVFTGNSALRRKLTECNDIPIATISSGLALKQKSGKQMNEQVLKDEKHLRSCIIKALKRQIGEGHTKPSIDYINMILNKAYESGFVYNVEDMKLDILTFALSSTNQGEYCASVVKQMRFKSESESPPDLSYNDDDPVVCFDIEVYPNLFIFAYGRVDEPDDKIKVLYNPSPEDMNKLIFKGGKKRWVGFNCRRYDNHVVYGRCLGYTNEMMFDISQRIINEKNDRGAFFGEAYNMSWADIYDYADVKQSLKKWEIALSRAKEMRLQGLDVKKISNEIGIDIPDEKILDEVEIHHEEMDWPWDQPIPEELWKKAGGYCKNDVSATKVVYKVTQPDLLVRKVLAELSGLSVNDPARLHVTKIIFGDDKNPELVYTDLSEMFPGYKYEFGHSSYRGEDPGEGGYVYAEPGMYFNTPVLDVESMHPTSAIELNLFGKYTVKFKEIKELRLSIKHGDFEKARTMFDGKLAKYLDDPKMAKALAKAFKLVINSVYGYTTAKFANPFKDPRNIDNIVAKRGALFMIDLKHEVQDRGFTVAHIKTDSIKIPNATPEIVQFVYDFGAKYGYKFAVEEEFEKLCLVNQAVFVGKEKSGEWITTGAQFQVPYVKKTLFTHEPLIFDDFCETRAVKTSMYLEFLGKDGEVERQFIGKVGRFCPMKTKGGRLVAERGDGKFNSVSDSKDWLWLESETVKALGYQDDIDYGYFEQKAEEAKNTISQYGDFEKFVS